MKLTLPKNTIVKIVGTFLLISAIFAGVYFFLIYPKAEAVKLKESELQSAEKLLSTLQSKVTNPTEQSFESAAALQKLVPVKPLSQQLLLDIEKAEVISNSFVTNMAFEDGDMEEETKNANGQAESNGKLNETLDQLTNEKNATLDNLEEGKETEEANTIPLPTGVKKISATLSIESPDYFEMEKFLTNLEGLDRIIVIESINFNAGEEITSTDQVKKPLAYEVKFSAFYMPTLTELLDQLPRIDAPEPSNKKNPLNTFGDFNKDKVQDTWSLLPKEPSDNQTENKTVKIVYYTVIHGDNLTKIAMEFYNTKKGVQTIKEANQLTNDKIFPGQVLIIPLKL